MARQRPADYLPAEVLARPDFTAACEARDIGAVLRLAKQWGGVGFTASHLARRCELTVSRVQDYISGRVQAQRIELFERVADGLRIPGAMLNLAPRPWEIAAEVTAEATKSIHDSDGGFSVLRRDFMRLGAGVAATTLVGLPSGVSGNKIGDSTVVELRDNMVRLRRLDDHLGGADTYRLYLAEVEKTAGLLKDASFVGGARRELLTLFAEQAQQAGWAAFDAGWHDQARDLYERSFNAAKEAENAGLAGNALAYRAYQLTSQGQDATDLSSKSFKIADKVGDPAIRSLLYQRGAWSFAVSGNAEGVARALGAAGDALADPRDVGPGPDWATWAHNQTELEIMAGRCWTELGRPLRAVPALESAMSRYDDSHARDKALYLSWLADAYLDAGEVEHAAASLDRAFDLSANVASARPQQRLSAVLERMAPHASVGAVTDLVSRRGGNPS
ncbi:hypothetical protein [Amycolatopsis sp. NPDC001319]|uniref:hypothetical protein n=1 Tax=unclassified Amycolatopsis TaxID=2618356 RepID=UPI0036B04B26